MLRKQVWLVLSLVAILTSCASRTSGPDAPDTDDEEDKPLFSQSKTFQVDEPLLEVSSRLETKLKTCLSRPIVMYAPFPIYIGETFVTTSIATGQHSGRIQFRESGVQSFVILQFDLKWTGEHSTEVETRIRHRSTDPARFQLWAEGGKDCGSE